jgi:hypothetical protein
MLKTPRKGLEAKTLRISASFDETTEERILHIFRLLNIPLVKIDDLKSEQFVEFIAKVEEKLIRDNNSPATVNAQENNLLIPSEPTLPFETSQNLEKVLRKESPPTENGKPDTIQLSQHQKQSLLYHQLREEQKRETARQTRFRKPQLQPVQDDVCDTFQQPCPLGYSKNYCFNTIGRCDRRGQCHREGIIKRNMYDFQEHPEPFKISDYVS